MTDRMALADEAGGTRLTWTMRVAPAAELAATPPPPPTALP